MANRTVKDAHSIKGTNPQYLIEKIIRTRIYEAQYWKEQCFALTAALMVDKAMGLKYIGGVYGGNIKPTPFICLVLKMLQIQPEKDIVVEFITQPDFKYVRALGAVYMRLTGTSLDCFKYLEPLYLDYRKMKRMNRDGSFTLIHMDEFIDELLREERICDVILPRIQKRYVLEETNMLEVRVSALEEDMEDMDTSEDEDDGEIKQDAERAPTPERRPGTHRDWERPRRSPSPRFRRGRSRSPERRNSPPRDRGRHHDRGRDYGDRERKERHRSRSKERHRERRHREEDRGHRSSRRHRHEAEEEDRHGRHKSKRSKRDGRDDHKLSREELEIREANEMRARLGLAPLRP